MLLRPLLKKFECETPTDTVDGALVNKLVSLLSNYGTALLAVYQPDYSVLSDILEERDGYKRIKPM